MDGIGWSELAELEARDSYVEPPDWWDNPECEDEAFMALTEEDGPED